MALACYCPPATIPAGKEETSARCVCVLCVCVVGATIGSWTVLLVACVVGYWLQDVTIGSMCGGAIGGRAVLLVSYVY